MRTNNIYNLNNNLSSKSEIFDQLILNKNLIIERIISSGHITPEGEWYDQEKDEWVLLLQGNAKIEFENAEQLEMKAGDYLLIPSHKKHRVSFTSSTPPCIWLAVHFRNKD